MNNFIENMLACRQPSLNTIIKVLMNIPIAINTTVTPVQIKTFFPDTTAPKRTLSQQKEQANDDECGDCQKDGSNIPPNQPISQKVEDSTQ